MVEIELALGIDIGGTNTVLGYVDREGHCAADSTMLTLGHQPPQTFFRRLHEQSDILLKKLGPGYHLTGIGIGAPNGNYYRNTIEEPPNIAWDYVDLQKELAPYYSVPVAVTNDANAAALGEMLFGAAKGMRDFIVITLGTGLGSGIVVNGELVYGHTGFAGEIGHTSVDPNGRECGCGRRGCLETYASATGVLRTTREILDSCTTHSVLRRVPVQELTSRTVFEAAKQGDPVALKVFSITGEILGRKLADSVIHTSPEAIILLGGLAAAGELLFQPTREALEQNLSNIFKNTVKLIPSGIREGNAAVLGAAALIWNKACGKVTTTADGCNHSSLINIPSLGDALGNTRQV